MARDKDITIYDIATQLGVSPSTVSRALKNTNAVGNATRKKILATARELGYQTNTFASNLRKQRSNTLGVMVHELRSNFITSVLSGIENVAAETNYDLIIAHSSENAKKERANANNLFHKRVDGLIASLASDTSNLHHFKSFVDKSLPVVFFDRVFEQDLGAKVIINNFKAGYDATQHLIRQGCERIAHITSSLNRNVYSERLRGYKAALADNGIAFDERMVIVDGLAEEHAAYSAKRILKLSPLPDGIFITNDFCAAVVMQVLKDAGIHIPEDMAIVGFNNDAISKVISPKLTTIDYPGYEMGQIAARQIISHLKGTSNINTTNTIILHSELIIRESSLKQIS
ncbi:LacI family DNA-binding transcriptional regulator [Flavihumibacter petaseus]|uniref:Putative LacI family transcriptional regulator n=1 Tax=Flavihumibacter petaseus NBRC 106054 TaxID=1220578 RepID=A0A0E9MYG5_9BACT|nr:LacI family DNA-binding transcriptional regulator [Flavihumibacter petaseus]GAO42634.1 putative LacI family transcriptional regulator [Flavihumibacter petaseus NBRC 106054]